MVELATDYTNWAQIGDVADGFSLPRGRRGDRAGRHGKPLSSVVAHALMHAAAHTHSCETDVFLPPQTDAP